MERSWGKRPAPPLVASGRSSFWLPQGRPSSLRYLHLRSGGRPLLSFPSPVKTTTHHLTARTVLLTTEQTGGFRFGVPLPTWKLYVPCSQVFRGFPPLSRTAWKMSSSPRLGS